MTKNIYAFYMPGEERIFFNYFHGITFAFLLLFSLLGVFITKLSTVDAISHALVFVLPFYGAILMFKKRFANEVTLDFDVRKIRFVFQDKRGTIEREFPEIKKVKFGYYLTFVMKDAKIMVKRPDNKKEIFQLLKSVFTVDCGIFPIK
ncbi:MAG: hypothetical protein IBX72_09990 [Nitrospirae bacterium]|nr:hypothetical protein [Nitrospirota bacterium]